MGEIKITTLDVMRDARWLFRDGKPRWQHQNFGSSANFDPFPAYAHQVDVVNVAVRDVQRHVTPLWNIELFIANREEEGRSNGYSSVHEDGHYEDEPCDESEPPHSKWVKDPPIGLIMLSGKRVPPHPAVTRYLVAHEYGHHIEWMLNHARRAKSLHSDNTLKEYAELRGLVWDEHGHHGEGGTWHNSIHEIFACDFRITVCDIEANYWPHPDVDHPLFTSTSLTHKITEWWENAITLLRDTPSPTAEIE